MANLDFVSKPKRVGQFLRQSVLISDVTGLFIALEVEPGLSH